MTYPERSIDHHIDRNKRVETAVTGVDVLIAAWDRADTIERAVSSALAQDEVRTAIVVDDGSADDTAARARRCDPEGKRLIVKRLPRSVGPSAARNIAIGISTAPWLAILDADDFFLPGRLRALLSHSENCDFMSDLLAHVSEDRVSSGPRTPVLLTASMEPVRLSFEQFVLGNVTQRDSHRKELGYLKPLIRRSFLDANRLRYDETLRLGEDYVLYARALALGARFLVIPTAGYVAVERADSLSARHSRRDLEILHDRVWELMAMTHLAPSEREALVKHCVDIDRRAQWLAVVEALQSHNYPKFLSTFFQSPALSLYLTGRFIEEIPLQMRRRLRYPPGR